jgi:hypothetical protein
MKTIFIRNLSLGRQWIAPSWTRKGRHLLQWLGSDARSRLDRRLPGSCALRIEDGEDVFDLGSKTGGPIENLGFKAGGYSDVQVDGRNFLMVPNEDYSETTAYEVVDGEAKPGFKIQGSVDHIVKLR